MSDAELDFLRQLSEGQRNGPRQESDLSRTERRKQGRRRKKKKRGRRIAPVLALIFLVAVVGGGGYVGYSALRTYMKPPDYPGAGTGKVTVQIRDGDSIALMANRLKHADVVKSVDAFIRVAKKDPTATSIQPGFYQMRQRMSSKSALALLHDPSSRAGTTVSVPEGLRLEQTLQLLSKKTRRPISEFRKAASRTSSLGLPAYAHGNLEGYLYPARYDLKPKASARDLLKMMVTRYKQELGDLPARAAKVHLTPAQVIVAASLVQAEGGDPTDYPKIARVLFNRIAEGRRLQLDTTVLYAQKRVGTLRVLNKDTQVQSPYNTYQIKGLPPGAIDSPGKEAVDAALSPAKGNWIWFVTTDPSKRITKFTNKETEFVKFRHELDAYLTAHGQ